MDDGRTGRGSWGGVGEGRDDERGPGLVGRGREFMRRDQ